MGEPQTGPVSGEVVDGVHAWGWQWNAGGGPSRGSRGGSRLPWFGVFLLVFGGLLLVRRLYPSLDQAGSLLLLAAGITFLVFWLVNRGVGSLYLGSIVTALAAPDLLSATGVVSGAGVGTLCLGIAFLFIALVRAVTRGGWGWQAILGAILVGFGGSTIAVPGFGDLVWPVTLVALGAMVLLRAARPPR